MKTNSKSNDNEKTDDQRSSSESKADSKQTANSKQDNHPVRRLLTFQVKLAVDAFRDIALSPVAIIATVIDLVEGRQGGSRLFEKLMKFGRVSEKHINLFDQHKYGNRTVDSVLSQVEDILVNEYKNGDISAKAKAAIEDKLKIQMKRKKE